MLAGCSTYIAAIFLAIEAIGEAEIRLFSALR
jgi:hypothetical protein